MENSSCHPNCCFIALISVAFSHKSMPLQICLALFIHQFSFSLFVPDTFRETIYPHSSTSSRSGIKQALVVWTRILPSFEAASLFVVQTLKGIWVGCHTWIGGQLCFGDRIVVEVYKCSKRALLNEIYLQFKAWRQLLHDRKWRDTCLVPPSLPIRASWLM